MKLGAIAGLAGATLYGLGVLLFLLSIMARPSPGTPPGDYAIQLLMVPVTLGIAVYCIGFIGIFPATLLGLMLGAAIGGLISLLHLEQAPLLAALVGLVTALAIVLILHWLLPFSGASSSRDYWLYQGVPSLIYLAAGGWLGWKLAMPKT
jgi:hypothetical protein